MAKYTPDVVRVAKSVLRKLRKRLPGAVEMVYDNYNGLVIGFGPTERPSEAIFSVVLWPRYVILCFLQGAKLRDPQKILRGGGVQVRNIILDGADDLDKAEVEALIGQALDISPRKIFGKRQLIIKSVSAKQRPRRPRPDQG